jgi:hypothetical protein
MKAAAAMAKCKRGENENMAAINAASGLQLASIIMKENRKKENETSCCGMYQQAAWRKLSAACWQLSVMQPCAVKRS